jgi:predicted PurR-regulated permease PerM
MNRKLTVSLIIALLALALAVLALASVIIFNAINFSNFNTIQTLQQTPQQTPASQKSINGTSSQLIKPIVNPTPIPVSASSGTILASSDIGVYSDSAAPST